MKKSMLFPAGLIAGTILAACQSTPEEGGGKQIIQQPDGSFIVLDESGDPSDDEAANAVTALLGRAMAKQEAPMQLDDEEIWHADPNGNLTHIQSGGICPQEWGEFSRVSNHTFKRDGTDVSCNFQSGQLQASFTFYFYRNAQSVQDELSGVMDAIKYRVPDSKMVETNLDGLRNHELAIGMVESVGSDAVRQRDGALISKDSGWQVKLRVTFLTGRDLEMELIAGTMLQAQLDQINEGGFTPLREIQPGDELKTEF